MKILEGNTVFIDIDDTLIFWEREDVDSFATGFKINETLIDKIKFWKNEGKSIVLWSSNYDGVDHVKWAVNACKKVFHDFETYVDVIMVKPNLIVDDDHLEYYTILNPRELK